MYSVDRRAWRRGTLPLDFEGKCPLQDFHDVRKAAETIEITLEIEAFVEGDGRTAAMEGGLQRVPGIGLYHWPVSVSVGNRFEEISIKHFRCIGKRHQ